MHPASSLDLLKSAGAAWALGLALAGSAQAAEQADWSVKGSIQPSGCSVVLSGGGEANFGVISSAEIRGWDKAENPARYTRMSFNRSINIAVNCPVPSKVGLYVSDNREATMAGPDSPTRFGLGTYTPPGGSATNIGSYQVGNSHMNLRLTAAGPSYLARTLLAPGLATAESTFSNALEMQTYFLHKGYTHAYSMASTHTPDAMVSLQGPLFFSIEPLAEVVDRATSDIVMDGRATLTLVAL